MTHVYPTSPLRPIHETYTWAPPEAAAIDDRGDYVTVWHVQPPAMSEPFISTSEQWTGNYAVRHIYAWASPDAKENAA